jgi:hypothetical protein
MIFCRRSPHLKLQMMDTPTRIQTRLDYCSKSSSCIEPTWDERRIGGASVSDSTLFSAQELGKATRRKKMIND